MDQEIIKILKRKFRWSEDQIKLGLRAKFKCEYCDKDLLLSVDNYKLWQKDHIIPLSSKIENFDYESFENLAIACRQCNINFKGKYNVAGNLGYQKSRLEYLLHLRKYITEIKLSKENELNEMKKYLIQ